MGPIVKGWLKRRKLGQSRGVAFGFQPQNLNPDIYFTMVIFLFFATTTGISLGWEFGARLVPLIISIAGLLFVAGILFLRLFIRPAQPASAAAGSSQDHPPNAGDAFNVASEDEVHFDIQADYGDLGVGDIFTRAANYFGWLLFFLGSAFVVGLLPAMFLFLAGYMHFEGKETWKTTFAIAVPMWAASYALFHVVLVVPWPQFLVGNIFPGLRASIWVNLF